MEILRIIWEKWKRVGQVIGDLIGRVVLTIFYFTLMLPFGIGVRLLGDPLAIKTGMEPGWISRKTRDQKLDDARRLS